MSCRAEEFGSIQPPDTAVIDGFQHIRRDIRTTLISERYWAPMANSPFMPSLQCWRIAFVLSIGVFLEKHD